MDINSVKAYYSEIISKQENILQKLKKKIFQIGTVRLIVVLIGIITTYFVWGNGLMVFSTIIITLAIFLCLMRYHSELFKNKVYCEQLIINAQNELKGLDYNFSAYDGAVEKIDGEHSFSLDLDLFGNRSFFQSINRTVTSFGKETLSDNLIHPLKDKNTILDKQQAIEELKQKKELLTHFRAIGQTSEMDNLSSKNFVESFKKPPLLCNSIVWNALVYIFPILYIALGILVYMDIIPGVSFIILYLVTFGISSIPMAKSTKIKNTFESKSQILDTYSHLFKIVENEVFESHLLNSLQNQLKIKNQASKATSILKTLLTNLEMAAAYPVLLFLNPVLLWNVKYGIKVEKWTQEYKDEIIKWFESIAEFDALASWGIFAFNHPDYIFPKPETNKFVFAGKALGHPMLGREKCVRNDIDISKTPYFLVITGANMAGKSTYLRTIGINHTLACAGAPVCAESLTFYPGNLVTNLRTADSLADNESYFFAELKRLKMIIDRLQSGEELFIILDEILKGTNSIDKQKGSLALMKQLVSLNGNGIIATHDLLLGTLEDEYPDNIKNYCFEADITNNHLSFTYQIREGIAQNMNASFLMKQMGITGL